MSPNASPDWQPRRVPHPSWRRLVVRWREIKRAFRLASKVHCPPECSESHTYAWPCAQAGYNANVYEVEWESPRIADREGVSPYDQPAWPRPGDTVYYDHLGSYSSLLTVRGVFRGLTYDTGTAVVWPLGWTLGDEPEEETKHPAVQHVSVHRLYGEQRDSISLGAPVWLTWQDLKLRGTVVGTDSMGYRVRLNATYWDWDAEPTPYPYSEGHGDLICTPAELHLSKPTGDP